MPMIRSSLFKAAFPAARRTISSSSKTNNIAAVSLGHESSMAASSPSASSTSAGGRIFKAVVYITAGSTAAVAGISYLLKDEVLYWTPNVRK
ncbi:hypothetical protein BGZ58_004060 [Dissophora ornata]|nr:hypothetical protein BGZ58_004060 [Dissophora ornata]